MGAGRRNAEEFDDIEFWKLDRLERSNCLMIERMKGNEPFPVNFFLKNDRRGRPAITGQCGPGPHAENHGSFLLKAKILWLDIEMRCADCAAAKVENYF
jgi:hypothetical protein